MKKETPKLRRKEEQNIVRFYIERSERTSWWYQLIAVAEDGTEYYVSGDYCGGIPASSWHKVKGNKPLT